MSDTEINILIVVNNSKFDYRIIFLFHIILERIYIIFN